LKKAYLICRLRWQLELVTIMMKSIMLIVLVTMLTIANTKANPIPTLAEGPTPTHIESPRQCIIACIPPNAAITVTGTVY
jgi:hypothetical protein